MNCQAFNITFRALSKEPPLSGHAYKNKLNLIGIQQAKEEFEKLMGKHDEDDLIEIIFSSMPAKPVLKALAVLIGRADSLEDLKEAREHSEVFSGIKECNPINETTKLTMEMHSLINDIESFIKLATSKDSDYGELISEKESVVILKLIGNMDKLQQDLALFVNSRRV